MKVIYPPRPKGKISPNQLPAFERKGKYCVQPKLAGHRCLIHICESAKVSFYSRHGKSFARNKWLPPPGLQQEVLNLKLEQGAEYWLDGELIHMHRPHTIVLFDLLQAGRYLYGVRLKDRLAQLSEICSNPTAISADLPVGLRVSEHLWLVYTWHDEFARHFLEVSALDVGEGLVVKEMDSRLDSFGHHPYSVDWQIRCRKPGASWQY